MIFKNLSKSIDNIFNIWYYIGVDGKTDTKNILNIK